MKRNVLTLVLLFCVFYLSHGQTQRLVLLEEFMCTNALGSSQQNSIFDPLIQTNFNKVTALRYHVNLTGYPANDPMCNNDAADMDARSLYYNLSLVPFCYNDGIITGGLYYNGSPMNITQTKIDSLYAIPSPFSMQLKHGLSANQDTAFVTLLVSCTQAVSGPMVAQIAEIEKYIYFSVAPGDNGLTDFYNVPVKMAPTASGTALPSSMAVGDYALLQYAVKLPTTIYDVSQLGAIAWVQNNTTKKSLQACNSSAQNIIPLYNTDATITSLSNVPTNTCANSISPTVTIQNNGNQTLTSLSIKYYVNGSTPSVYQWNGTLNFLQKATITLPATGFNLADTNKLVVKVYNPNGQTDQYPKNDSVLVKILKAPYAQIKVHLDLKTDNNPGETTWNVKKASTGQVIASGGPYTQASTTFAYDIYPTSSGCYVFTIFDAGGNGLESGNGHGHYLIYDSIYNDIGAGNSFGASKMHSFDVLATGIENISNIRNIKVYPNPFSQQFNLLIDLEVPGDAAVEVYNCLGEKVMSRNFNKLSQGENEISMDGSQLSAGIYFLKLKIGKEVRSLKITRYPF